MKNITDLIKLIKGQDELMSLEEVNAMMGSSLATSPNHKWKYFGAASLILLVGIVGYFLLQKPNTERGTTSQIRSADTTETVESKLEENTKIGAIAADIATTSDKSKAADYYENKSETQVTSVVSYDRENDSPDRAEPSIKEKSAQKEAELENVVIQSKEEYKSDVDSDLKFEEVRADQLTTAITKIVNGNDPKLNTGKIEIAEKSLDSSRIPKSILANAITLTDKELEAFHIFKEDDVLLYSRTRDKIEGLELKFIKDSDGITSISNLSTPIKKLTPEHPMAIVAPGKSFYEKRNLEIKKLDRENSIPLLVKFDFGQADFTVWWFEKNKININKLPKRFLNNINDYCVIATSLKNDTINQKPNKPKNTKAELNPLYNHQQLIVATEADLKKLNISKNSYKLKYQNGFLRFLHNDYYYKVNGFSSTLIGPNNIEKLSQQGTTPSYITSHDSFQVDIRELLTKSKGKLDPTQNFYANKHKMLAVDIGKVNNKQYTLWYENPKKAFKTFGPHRSKDAQNYLAQAQEIEFTVLSQQYDHQTYQKEMLDDFKSLTDLNINPVILNLKELAELNIYFEDKKICHVTYHPSSAHINKMTKKYTESVFKTGMENSKKRHINPVHISDKFGKSFRMQTAQSNRETDLDKLIAVYVASKEEFHLSDYLQRRWHPDCIFWYEPTDEFLELLPKDIKEQLEYELAIIENTEDPKKSDPSILQDRTSNGADKMISCIYLDPCADVKSNITDLKLYPNPTKGIINLAFTLNNPVGGDISIINLVGQSFLKRRLENCSVKTQIDVSGLPAGLYLVTLLSDEGDKLTRRIIKE